MATDKESQLVRKLDFRIIPWIWLLYLLNYIDRVNLGNVKGPISEAIGLTEMQYTLCVGIFFVGYVIFEIPSNLMLKKATPSRWIARIMVGWGIVTICMILVTDFASLMVCRAILGVMEAGFFPGIIFYLTFWYKKEEQAVRQSLFFTATSVAGATAGLIAGGLLRLGGSLQGWQWVFVVEGIPSVLFGILTWFYLPDFPHTAKFLTAEERQLAHARLEKSVHASHFSKKEFLKTITDLRVWLFAFLYVCVVNPLKAVTFFLPTLVQSFGYSGATANLMTAPIYFFAALTTVAMAYSSDRKRERPFHLLACEIGGMVGFALLGIFSALKLYEWAYAAAFLVAGSVFPGVVLNMTYLTNSIRGSTSAATSTALVISMGNIGGFFTPQLFGLIKSFSGSYDYALGAMSLLLFFSIIILLVLRHLLKTRGLIDHTENFVALEMENQSMISKDFDPTGASDDILNGNYQDSDNQNDENDK